MVLKCILNDSDCFHAVASSRQSRCRAWGESQAELQVKVDSFFFLKRFSLCLLSFGIGGGDAS